MLGKFHPDNYCLCFGQYVPLVLGFSYAKYFSLSAILYYLWSMLQRQRYNCLVRAVELVLKARTAFTQPAADILPSRLLPTLLKASCECDSIHESWMVIRCEGFWEDPSLNRSQACLPGAQRFRELMAALEERWTQYLISLGKENIIMASPRLSEMVLKKWELLAGDGVAIYPETHWWGLLPGSTGIAQHPAATCLFSLLARGRAVLWFSHSSLWLEAWEYLCNTAFTEEMLN